MPPTFRHGKICYIQLPARDIAASAEFYAAVFGWRIRERSDGSTAFDDGVGEVSGTWVLGRPPATAPGLLVYVMVDDAEATVGAIVAAGGEIVQAIGGDAPEITARFRDPAGNVLGIFQQVSVSPDDVRRIALALPGVLQDGDELRYHVKGGKAFAWTWKKRVEPKRARVEQLDVYAVRVSGEDEKQALLASEPAIFFTEPHYDGYPAVLVRLDAIDENELMELLTDGWRAAAPRRLLSELDG